MDARVDLNSFYSPLYEKELWWYQTTNADLAKGEITELNWLRIFSNVDFDEKVFVFSSTILLLSTFIPHETASFEARGQWEKYKYGILLLKNISVFNWLCMSKTIIGNY